MRGALAAARRGRRGGAVFGAMGKQSKHAKNPKYTLHPTGDFVACTELPPCLLHNRDGLVLTEMTQHGVIHEWYVGYCGASPALQVTVLEGGAPVVVAARTSGGEPDWTALLAVARFRLRSHIGKLYQQRASAHDPTATPRW